MFTSTSGPDRETTGTASSDFSSTSTTLSEASSTPEPRMHATRLRVTISPSDWEKIELALAQRVGVTAQDVLLAAFKLGWWELVVRWAKLDGVTTDAWLAQARGKRRDR